jgi:hypothetical protein
MPSIHSIPGDFVPAFTPSQGDCSMTSKTVTGLFDNYDDAKQAVHALEASGVPHGDISIVANNADNRYKPAATAGETSNAAKGAEAGATFGAIVGGDVGLLAGLGMLAIPGVGPVVAAGWLVAAAAGAVAGAAAAGAAGGLIGSLTSAGVSKEHADIYAEGVRRGGTLVTARVDENREDTVEAIMVRFHTVDLDRRGTAYRTAGWKAFDAKALPYGAADLKSEQDRYRSRAAI